MRPPAVFDIDGTLSESRASIHRVACEAARDLGLHGPDYDRTHRLRARMAAIGRPIPGDPKHRDETSKELSGPLKLRLHARRIELEHPSGGMLVVEAPLSPEMRAGFAHFGFGEAEGNESDPIEGVKSIR